MTEALFRKLDNHLLRVDDLDAAIAFYRDRLGHRLIWRNDEAAGLALPETDAELVLHRHIGPETDILVERPGMGRATFYAAVSFAESGDAGSVRRMRLVGASGRNLIGAAV